MEVLAPSAILAIERAQIDTQVATAHQYPRSLEQFRKRALGMATLDEETAESCIYVRPVGKEKDDRGQWVEKYAEGPSIRLAEIVGSAYGNLRVSARVIEQTERFVRCEGTAHDLETNFAGKSEVIEATVTKDGKPYSERQRALIAKVALAKAFRDAVFKVVPRSLCKPVFDAAKKIAVGQGKPLEERRKKARAWVSTIKIDESRVFAAMGVQGWSEITDDHLLKLTGLKTAIGDGDETVDTAFPKIESPDAHKPVLPGNAPKTTQERPAPVNTPPAASNAAPAPAASAIPPSGESPGPSDEQAEAEAGLAPSQTETQTSAAAADPPGAASTAPAPAAAAPPAPTGPKGDPATFKPRDGEGIPLTSVRRWLHLEAKTEAELLTVLVANKAAKAGQKLNELSEAKLDNVYKARSTLLTQMNQQPSR